eukprot:jgi/Ulvmu1/7084/UM033_0145.1
MAKGRGSKAGPRKRVPGKSGSDAPKAEPQVESVAATDLTPVAPQIAPVGSTGGSAASTVIASASASVPAAETGAAAPASSSNGAPNGMQKITIPSRPYVPPPNLSAAGRALYEKVKPVLDNTIDKLAQTIVDTEFCEATDENTRKIDIRILQTLFDLLGETMRADPNSASEVFKRFVSIKNMTKRADDPGAASWASLLGQQGLVRAQEIKMEAVKKAPRPPPGENTIQLGAEVAQEMHIHRMDALVFLLISNQFFETALGSKPEMLGNMDKSTAYKLYNLARVALGFAFRHTPDNHQQRTKYWTAVADDESEHKSDPLLKGLATYALAFDACKAEDRAGFERLLKRSRECWAALQDKPMTGFITRNLDLGVCTQCMQEMTGIMDGCEMRFKQFVEAHVRMQQQQRAAVAAAAEGGAGKAGSSKGVRLVPGGVPDKEAGASQSASGLRVASNAQQANMGIQALREEMKSGYQLYDDQQMDAGVEHFGRLLKRAYELPLSGMSISLMFSLSHAHIEGAAQLRRWGKAEDTISKLRAVAEFASGNKIPNAIESIADRLHLWWREKQANIYSRQRKFDKAVKTLEGAVEHAEALSKRSEAGIMILLTSAHVESFLSGSPQADLGALQACLDRGIATLRADPPPVGGAAGANGQTPTQQWAGDTKLETWIKLVPMLRAMAAEGLEIEAAEATLLPLADKFDLQVGQTVFNAEQYVQTAMREDRKLLGARVTGISGTTVLFGVAVLLPILLMVWLAYYALTAPDEVEGVDGEYEADGPGAEL